MKASTFHKLVFTRHELAKQLGYDNPDSIAIVTPDPQQPDNVLIEISYLGLDAQGAPAQRPRVPIEPGPPGLGG